MIDIVTCLMTQCPYNAKVNEDKSLSVCTKKMISIAPNGQCSQLVKNDGQQRRFWDRKEPNAIDTVNIVETVWHDMDAEKEASPHG